MNHLDEGTIHGWLDGALDDTQSREIEAHVASCAACSAAVAEARGLIAGATRILGALDDVPGGVIPGGATAAPPIIHRDSVTSIGSRRGAPRRWRVTRWASGIAAVLVAAIVLTTTSKIDRSEELSQATPGLSVDTATVRSEADAGTPVGTSGADRNEAASPASAPTPLAARDARPLSTGTGGSSARTSTANQATKAPRQVARRSVADAVAPSAPSPSAPPAVGAQEFAAVRGTPAVPQQDSSRLRRPRVDNKVALESVAIDTDAAMTLDAARFVGCYRIDAARERRLSTATGGVAGSAASPRAERRAAVPSAAAAAQTSDFSARALPLIRLDSARSESGYAVIRLPTDSTIGSWNVVRDSARLDLGSLGVVTVAALQKVACP